MNWYKKAQPYEYIRSNPDDYVDPEEKDRENMINTYLYYSIGQDEDTIENSTY